MFETFTDFMQTAGPNITYISLIAAIWLTITAIYMAGTGIPEVLAILFTIVGIGGLFYLPVNWIGFILLLLGLVSFIMYIFYMDYPHFIAAGASFQLVGSFLLFKPEARVGIVAVLLVNISTLIYYQLILAPGLRIQRQPHQYVGTDPLIGATGEVTSPLDPTGMVRIHGELWKAHADTPLERGQRIRVTALHGLEVHVQPEQEAKQ